MKHILLIATFLLLAGFVESQNEAEEIFRKYYSDYIENYSPESGNIPTDLTIEDFRKQYQRLDHCIEDFNIWRYEAGEPSILKLEDFRILERSGQIETLVEFIKEEMLRYKRFLGKNHEFGVSKDLVMSLYLKLKSTLKSKDHDKALVIWRELFVYFSKYKYAYSKGDVLIRHKIKMIHDSARKYDLLISEAMNKKRLSDSVKIYTKRHKDLMQEKELYIDTLLMIYDRRIKYLGNAKTYGEGYLIGKKGTYIYRYKKECCLEEAYQLLIESINIEKENTFYNVIKDFYDVSKELYNSRKIDFTEHHNNYYKCMTVLRQSNELNMLIIERNNNLCDEEYVNEAEKFISNNEKVSVYIERSFYKSPIKCETLIPVFEKEFEKRKNDTEWLKRVYDILTYKGCIDNSFYYKLTLELETLKFSPDSAYKKAVEFINKESYDEAFNYIKAASLLERDSVKKSLYLYTAAVINFAKNDYPKSREFALEAASYRSNFGKPYILIAKLYASSSNMCGTDQFERGAVYWAAVDKLEYAKSIDPACSEEADKLIQKYSFRFPNLEHSPRLYQTREYKVGCWIQEITKTRYFKK